MNQMQIHAAAALIFLLSGVVSIRLEQRRLVNGFLLELGIYHLAISGILAIPNSQAALLIGRIFVVCILAVLIVTGLFLLADGFFVIRKEGKSLAHALPVFWGIVLLIGAYAWYRDCFFGLSGSFLQVVCMTFLMNLVLYVPMALAGVRLYSWIYRRLKKPADAPYIVVLGCKIAGDGTVTPLLKGRLDTAIHWYALGGERAKIIVSGGRGKDEVTSEADAMKRYLMDNGIDEERILMEDRSANTRENLLFSKEIMIQDGGEARFLIVTSNYHVMRSVIAARELKLDAQGVGGRTALYYETAARLREYVALVLNHKIALLVYLAYVVLMTAISAVILR